MINSINNNVLKDVKSKFNRLNSVKINVRLS